MELTKDFLALREVNWNIGERMTGQGDGATYYISQGAG
jgi:hypothetical protein